MLSYVWHNLIFFPILNLLILMYFYGGQNLGIAVIGITVLIRTLLIPSTYKQVTMGFKMKLIAPELKILQKKFKKKPQQLAKAQTQLYKKVGYSPLGCFGNLLIQFPILIALYQGVLVFTKESVSHLSGLYAFTLNITGKEMVFNNNFLGMDLLSSTGKAIAEYGWIGKATLPFLLLTIIMVGTQMLAGHISQQVSNPTKPDDRMTKKKNDEKEKGKGKEKKKDTSDDMEKMTKNMTKSMTYFLPIIIAFSLAQAPAVLSFYWIVQSLIGIVQQRFILHVYKIRHPKEAAQLGH